MKSASVSPPYQYNHVKEMIKKKINVINNEITANNHTVF